MVAKVVVKTRGGERLKQFLHDARRESRAFKVEVGFDDKRIAPLAAQLEIGNPSNNLPERPAFRAAIKPMAKAASDAARSHIVRGQLTYEGAVAAALAARDVLRASYLDFHGPGLSERQERRKRGTRGAGKELIGSEGPKLAERIQAFVNGKQVG